MDKLAHLTQIVTEFCEQRDWDQFHNPKDLAIGIVTEGSELLDLFRFKSAAQIAEKMASPADRNRIEEELADVLFFVLRFAQMNQIDLDQAVRDKLKKNAAKYPVSTSKGSNKKYNE